MKYLIDTNIIIDFLNKDPGALAKLIDLASQSDNELFINRLVRLESLRTIPEANSHIFRKADETLSAFTVLDIKPDIYEQAISFSRYCRKKGISLKGRCEAIDFLHLITAKYYQLILLTNDKGLLALEQTYADWQAQL